MNGNKFLNLFIDISFVSLPFQITDDVFCIGSDAISGSGDCMVYAIADGNEHYCLIDAGTQNMDRILENLESTPLNGRTPSTLILTHAHYDHIGAAHQFKAKFQNMKIIAHDWDVPAIEGQPGTSQITAASWYGEKLIPVKVDVKIKGESEQIQLSDKSLIVVHTPGHTPGSIVLFYEHPQAGLVLFGQDIHGPFMPEFNSNKQDWRISMKKLLSYKPTILCEGHFGVIKGEEDVSQFINGYLKRIR